MQNTVSSDLKSPHFKSPHLKGNVAIGTWLLICALTVYLMIIVGGATRLTQSGLSMVEWEPIMGVIPPLSLADWQDVFEKYRASPEYQKVNFGMELEEFKVIFWWEYGHRVLGRFIGILFFIPFLIFFCGGFLTKQWKLKFSGLFLLGGLQGLAGWYMVKSGLVDDPHVSQYRLALHFGIALLIYTFLIWFMLDSLRTNERRDVTPLRNYAKFATLLTLFMMVTGAFVAGLKAGHIYNTFPNMGQSFVPESLWAISPGWKNLFENPATVQFIHRMTAYSVMITIAVLVWQCYRHLPFDDNESAWLNILIVAVLLIAQVSIGIITLLNKVPVFWGVLHQGTAVALLTSLLFLWHRFSRNY
jgi:cytochrome c oxidase assembly protein subunit 15